VINDLSLPERLAGKVATFLERSVQKLQRGESSAPFDSDFLTARSLSLTEAELEEGRVSVGGQVAVVEASKYQPASELRRQGLLPPLPPTEFSVPVVDLPPPSPRTSGTLTLVDLEQEAMNDEV
jgi:hypothetical protein